MKKVLSVVLALVLALGVCAVAVSAATKTDLESLLASIPNEYNAQFYNDTTKAAILEARTAATAAIASGDAAAIDDAYSLCSAAKNLATQKTDIYIEEDDDYVPFYTNRDESKAIANLDMETNAGAYLKAGDTFDVTVSIDANFIIYMMNLGLAYDKTKLEFVSDSYPSNDVVAPLDSQSSAIQTDWAHKANGSEKVNVYPENWTPEMKAQYGIICKLFGYNVNLDRFFKPAEKTVVMTLTFKVKENVEDGEALIFFDHGLQATYEKYILDESAPAILIRRAYSETRSEMVADVNGRVRRADAVTDDQAIVGQTINFTTEQLSLNIGEAPVPADYTELDAAINSIDNYNEADYTAESWKAFKDAVDAGADCDRNLLAADQGTIDALKDAIIAARDALELAQEEGSAIISVTPVGRVALGELVTLEVKVEGSPAKIRFANSENKTITLTRTHTSVNSIVANDDDTETWTVVTTVRKASDNYQAFARYGSTWSTPGFKFKLEVSNGIDKNVYSYSIDGAEEGRLLAGRHTVTVVTGLDVNKVQFVRGSATTTYSASNASYEDVNGQRVWTINFNFAALGSINYAIRVRTVATAFETSDVAMQVEVLY